MGTQTWKSISITGADIGFNITGGTGGSVGSIAIVDSIFQNTAVAMAVRGISTSTSSSSKGGSNSTGISLDNVVFDSTPIWLRSVDPRSGAATDSTTSGRKSVDSWSMGHHLDENDKKMTTRDALADTVESNVLRTASLLSNDNPNNLPKKPFFERPKPQYADRTAGDFVHLRDVCKGDGAADDTACFQKALDDSVAENHIVYVDAGTYLLSDTVLVPSGARIVGEVWSQLAATGAKFQDPLQPRPMLRVGRLDQIGSVEMQDLLFTTKGQTPGVVLVEWNLQANTAGAAGMWDCHARIGGASGTGLTSKECPPATSGIDAGCNGGSLMVHLTKGSSSYIENAWFWVADQ